jgi:hypothetical protein
VVVDDAELEQIARRDPKPASNLGGDHHLAFGECSNSLHGDKKA